MTLPLASQQATVCPPTAITRFTKSFSSGGAMPTTEPTALIALPNQVVGPAQYGPDRPFLGGPSALARLERDVIGLSGVSTVIWLEGTNDFSRNGNASFDAVRDGMRRGVVRLREAIPGVRVVGATLVSAT